MGSVPLSPEEQRILQEIEKSFYEHDPQFSKKVSESTIYRVAGRNLKWLALGFVLAFAFTIWSFAQSLPLAVLGFLGMLACAFFFERNLRKLGRAGWQSLTGSMRSGGLGGPRQQARPRPVQARGLTEPLLGPRAAGPEPGAPPRMELVRLRISASSCACPGSSFSDINAGPMPIRMFSFFATLSKS